MQPCWNPTLARYSSPFEEIPRDREPTKDAENSALMFLARQQGLRLFFFPIANDQTHYWDEVE